MTEFDPTSAGSYKNSQGWKRMARAREISESELTPKEREIYLRYEKRKRELYRQYGDGDFAVNWAINVARGELPGAVKIIEELVEREDELIREWRGW